MLNWQLEDCWSVCVSTRLALCICLVVQWKRWHLNARNNKRLDTFRINFELLEKCALCCFIFVSIHCFVEQCCSPFRFVLDWKHWECGAIIGISHTVRYINPRIRILLISSDFCRFADEDNMTLRHKKCWITQTAIFDVPTQSPLPAKHNWKL